ncbi:MAG: hypothetical protein WA667_15085, partial [Candidatus Nitrosopolaris sp.]
RILYFGVAEGDPRFALVHALVLIHKKTQFRPLKTFYCLRCHSPVSTIANLLLYCKECQRIRHNEQNRKRSLIHEEKQEK